MLTPALLRAGKFGRVRQFSVEGQVYAHPLVVPDLTIKGKTVTGLIIATEKNYVGASPFPDFHVFLCLLPVCLCR